MPRDAELGRLTALKAHHRRTPRLWSPASTSVLRHAFWGREIAVGCSASYPSRSCSLYTPVNRPLSPAINGRCDLGEEVRGGLLSTVGRTEEVHALRHLVYGAPQVGPRSVDHDVCFDQAPADLHRALPAAESFLSGGKIFHIPPNNGDTLHHLIRWNVTKTR